MNLKNLSKVNPKKRIKDSLADLEERLGAAFAEADDGGAETSYSRIIVNGEEYVWSSVYEDWDTEAISGPGFSESISTDDDWYPRGENGGLDGQYLLHKFAKFVMKKYGEDCTIMTKAHYQDSLKRSKKVNKRRQDSRKRAKDSVDEAKALFNKIMPLVNKAVVADDKELTKLAKQINSLDPIMEGCVENDVFYLENEDTGDVAELELGNASSDDFPDFEYNLARALAGSGDWDEDSADVEMGERYAVGYANEDLTAFDWSWGSWRPEPVTAAGDWTFINKDRSTFVPKGQFFIINSEVNQIEGPYATAEELNKAAREYSFDGDEDDDDEIQDSRKLSKKANKRRQDSRKRAKRVKDSDSFFGDRDDWGFTQEEMYDDGISYSAITDLDSAVTVDFSRKDINDVLNVIEWSEDESNLLKKVLPKIKAKAGNGVAIIYINYTDEEPGVEISLDQVDYFKNLEDAWNEIPVDLD